MKTETQIAKENVEKIDKDVPLYVSEISNNCQEHLASCQRFLKFLEDKKFSDYGIYDGGVGYSNEIDCSSCWEKIDLINNRLKDLKGAIKVYSDGGVR